MRFIEPSAAVLAVLMFGCSASRAEVVLASADDGRPTKYDDRNYHGRVATGERFDRKLFAVAHRTLPLNSCVSVGYRGRTHIAVVKDRGPCLSAWCQRRAPWLLKRQYDLWPALARFLHFPGLAKIAAEPVACPN